MANYPCLSVPITSASPDRPIFSSSSPHSHSQSPSRYVPFYPEMGEKVESANDLSDMSTRAGSSAPHQPASSYSRAPSQIWSQPAQLLTQRSPSQPQPYSRSRELRIAIIRPWLPIIFYALTSFGFVVAIAFYKVELFAALDELSRWLQTDPSYGHAILFFLIFLTTFPPIPLYSTLIILSGYTFGPWTGAVISYFAALSGALVVFMLSRTLLRESISRWLESTCTLKRVVRAIEKRPKLLFLIRLAPYPYNVMNCLLAASPSLTLRTYTVCTALSLFKVIIHSSLGASIHSFRDYHLVSEVTDSSQSEENNADTVARMWTIFGIALCVAIFIYLFYVARKAVDEELEGDYVFRPGEDGDEDETEAFLSPRGTGDLERCNHSAEDQQCMAESHPHQPISPRLSMSQTGESRGG